MRFTLDTPSSLSVTEFTRQGIAIGGRRYRGSLMILTGGVMEWDCASAAELTTEQLGPALADKPEVLLLGTGNRLRFPDVEIGKRLGREGVGFEVMDTRAACRTFNILLQEGRRVVAALIVE